MKCVQEKTIKNSLIKCDNKEKDIKIILKYMYKMNGLKILEKKNYKSVSTTSYMCPCGKGKIKEVRSKKGYFNVLIDCENCTRHYGIKYNNFGRKWNLFHDYTSYYKLKGDKKMDTFRIHGDNIVECERIADLIIKAINLDEIKTYLISPSTLAIEIKGKYENNLIQWKLELLPGFNKNTKQRWEGNIFDALKEAGSFFDETPDVIISHIDDVREQIILGIEFCSALQAGNQAWQRSARAFSTGRTGCPYLYIVDFVKYELDNATRERKNLRFPNAAVPYSYVNYSKTTGNFIAQLYIKSEEFDKSRDPSIATFDENDFGNNILGDYISKLMLGLDTSQEEKIILNKNMNVVQFLANHFDSRVNFTADEWKEIYSLQQNDIVDYAVDKKRFGFHKTITAKSHHGASADVIKLVDQLSVGLASRDLPFGIIPADKRKDGTMSRFRTT